MTVKLKYVRQFVKRVSPVLYIRCVDNGVGVLWAFCRNWMWSILQDFLRDKGYICAAISSSTARERIRQDIHRKGWDDNKAGQLAVLYLIGKGKSLKKGHWPWRGITTLPQPPLPKRMLRIAARANTTSFASYPMNSPRHLLRMILTPSQNGFIGWTP